MFENITFRCTIPLRMGVHPLIPYNYAVSHKLTAIVSCTVISDLAVIPIVSPLVPYNWPAGVYCLI